MSFVLDGQAQTHKHYQEIIDDHHIVADNPGFEILIHLSQKLKLN